MNPEESVEPGWFADPWGGYVWRWWDGEAWSSDVSLSRTSQPKIPNWLSIPVCVASFFSIPLTLIFLILTPVAALFSITPLAVLFPGLWWLNRIEPQPWSSRTHAFLWGAMLATLVSGFINTLTALFIGQDIAAIVSAPVVEEATKGLAIVWALKRKEIDGVVDGVIIACWSALGFAVIENMTYFAAAPDLGTLFQTVFLRGFLSPFAHPLFTFWTGLALGLSVRWRQPAWLHFLWGYPLAIVGHAGWNGTITYAFEAGDDGKIWFGYAGYLLLFLLVVVGLYLVRRHQQKVFIEQIPVLASRYQISKPEVEVFGHWRTLLSTRKTLSSRKTRNFDRLHAALAKLALAHGGPAKVTRAQEELLASQLQAARTQAFQATDTDEIDRIAGRAKFFRSP